MAVPVLTEQEKRFIRDYLPSLSNRPEAFDLAAKLDAMIADMSAIISGTATVADGATTVAVTVGAAYNGKPVVVSFAEAPTAAAIVSAAVATGDLTITIDADNTADLDVFYLIDGR